MRHPQNARPIPTLVSPQLRSESSVARILRSELRFARRLEQRREPVQIASHEQQLFGSLDRDYRIRNPLILASEGQG